MSQALPDRRVSFDNVAYTYAGVRPLSYRSRGDRRLGGLARAQGHRRGERDGRFLSVTGTKLTCFRSLAENVGDRVMRALGRSAPSTTARARLDGSGRWGGGVLEARVWLDVSEEMAMTGLSRETLEALVETYGRGYTRVLELAKKLPTDGATVSGAIPRSSPSSTTRSVKGFAVSLQDVLLGRTGDRSEPLPGPRLRPSGSAPRVAELVGWSPRGSTPS